MMQPGDSRGMMPMGYRRFGLTLLVRLLLMFLLSMSMVRSLDDYMLNLSNFWMALVMVSAMGAAMLISMWSMFRDRRTNLILLAGFAALFARCSLARSQRGPRRQPAVPRIHDPAPLPRDLGLPGVGSHRPRDHYAM